MKNKNKVSNINCVTSKSGCIKWDGPEIACLDICYGDELNDVVFVMAQKICSVLGGSDFSTLSLQCLIDKLQVVVPTERSILNLLQLAYDNDCKLKELIDKLEAKIIDPNLPLKLNLKCLTVLDGFGVPIPVTQLVLNQVLIDNFCSLKTKIAALEAQDINLQTQINALNVPGYAEPTLVTCWAGTRSLSQQVAIGYQNLCDYRNKVGLDIDIQTAISSQPPNLNPIYGSNVLWKLTPTSIAHSDSNQWVVIDNLMKRITALEACACKVTCKDIIVAFSTEFTDNKTVILKFTTGAGANIPTGFTNCGSTVTITNDKGATTFTIPIVIAQEGETIEIDLSMFEPGEYLTFNVDAKLCSSTLNCNKCVTKVIRNLAGCCEVKNSGSAPITITYKTCGITTPSNI